MFASLNQNWLSAKYHRTTNLTLCDRAVSYVIQTAEWSNELVWRCARIRDWRRARFLDLVFGECK